MESQNKIFVAVVAAVSLVVLVVLLQPTVQDRLAPEPVTAWVAIEVGGEGAESSGVAEVGPVALEVGTPFRLHAVLEARDRGGDPVYYTEAPRLRLDGEEVAAARLRRWDRPRPARIRWFTLEGQRPWVPLDPERGIGAFTFEEFLRSDWPVTWSIPGEVDAAHDDHLETGSAVAVQEFGTQRYHVRIELYRQEDDMIPQRVIRSWGVGDLRSRIDRFPTVVMTLPGAAAPASRVFGLSQLEPPAGAGPELLAQIDELARNGVAFSRVTVLRDQLEHAGKRFEDLEWRNVDLRGEVRWGRSGVPGAAGAGDLLRVGDRTVVLYEDRGEPGVLDYGDLCFDFVRGPLVRALGDVFAPGDVPAADPEEGQVVELASLQSSPPTPQGSQTE